MYIYRNIRTMWSAARNLLAAMSAVVLIASCGDIYEAQADIYDEYKAKVDTATSHKSLKELNDALEYEIVALLKENRERVVDAAKEGKKFKDSEKALAKAEANYVNAYLDKVVRMIVSEQKDKFIEYTQKLDDAATYDELAALNRSLNGFVTEINTKYADELKRVNARNMLKEQLAELEKARSAYLNAYVARVSPLFYAHEKGIYDKYASKVSAETEYEHLKLANQYCKGEIAIFYNENAVVLQRMTAGDYAGEKAAVTAAKESFEQSYLKKVSFPVLEYQKKIYTGAVELFADINNADELDKANRAFIDINNIFTRENSEELQWITAAAENDKAYRNAMDEVNACYEKVLDASDNKASELGLR